MSDAPVVHIGENSPEQVALKVIARVEQREFYAGRGNPADRKYILDTYAECLHAVRGYRDFRES